MNREILFRGKAGDEWVYGDLSRLKNAITITKRNFIYPYIVMPETVGQFTGLTDKNGVKIFEGDIIKHKENLFEIKYSTEQARYLAVLTNGVFDPVAMQNCEVVGNVFDNSELLKGEENE